MNGRTVKADRRGVTPVVGIVLLVAITILLASTVAAFALGMGNSDRHETAPPVAFSIDYDPNPGGNDELSITHQSGSSIDESNLWVIVDGASCSAVDPNGRHQASSFTSNRISSGVTITVDGSWPVSCGDLNLRSATVRIVWDPEVGSSQTYRTWSGPG